MLGLETLSGPLQAVGTVGVVLAEALALYVGYGALSHLAQSTILTTVRGD
ncbi:hypothetical protein J2752_002882 [Halarchaeum rubridurum]|uniref:Uncharacterized protein n=3 Tax=Halarchaeum TaxID=744724 RepID=A0A830G4M8_9EURY|nr:MULTISPECIES: hypothetical protein [Halarchaeum]MBP1955951.1 hypothetical protein [Halarchaeum rubridurum]GAD53830.1 hypothetical protein MBEHAL_2590 [Halarchaeum acidiphilum MH1-52-1]GGM75878.1 hypothetical protein GCM10009017_27270 [Halarchaeum rubridurum]